MPLTPARTLRIPSRYAMSFDGIDDYVVVLDSPSISITRSLTLSAWVKFNRIGTDTQIIGKESSTERGYYLAVTSSGAVRIFVSPTAGGTGSAFLTTAETLTPDIWYHLIGIFDAGKSLKIFIDSVEKAGTLTGTLPSAIYDNSANLRISSSERFPTQIMNGLIAIVYIYNRALSPTEVSWNFNNPFNPVRDGLVLSFIAHPDYVKDIDNDGILEWIDLSGNNNHGKIYGATLVDLFKTPVRTLPAVRTLPVAR
jgi:hypothetical protein